MYRKLNLFLLLLLLNCGLNAQSFFQITKAVTNDRDEFDKAGYSVSISGEYAIVGACFEDEDINGQNPLTDAGAVYIYKRQANGFWYQNQKLVPGDRKVNDLFGTSVSISGDYLVIGAPLEDHNASGSASLANSGSAYIFHKNSSGIWIELQKIVASDRQANDEFASSVCISGTNILIGSPNQDYDKNGSNPFSNAGASYVFEKNTSGNWIQVSKLVASDRNTLDNFGYSVSISGTQAIVGSPGEDEDESGNNQAYDAGSVYLFNKTTSWNQTQKLCATDRSAFDYFGASVSIYNNTAIVGAYAEDENDIGGSTKNSAGSAYILKNQTTWSVYKKIVANDRSSNDFFAYSVHISEKFAIVGAYLEDEDAGGSQFKMNAGSAYIFSAASDWSQSQKLIAHDRTADDRFGFSVAIDGNFAISGAHLEDHDESGQNTLSASGSAYINTYGYQINQYDTICDGEVYTYGTMNLTKAGTYRYMFQSYEGYDSVVFLRLHVNPVYTQNKTISICKGESILFGGQTLSVAGQYAHKYTTIKGCDSSVNLTLVVNPTYYEYAAVNLCNGRTLKFGKQTIANSGTYVETFSSAYGCDSTVELVVTIKPVYSFNIVNTICYGESYKFGKQTLTETGHYTEVFKTIFGCDSTINLSLNVSPKIDTSVSRNGSQLSANNSAASYQWIDCTKGNTPISGATNKTFSPSKNGIYSVIITQYNCSDTSWCYNVNSIGIYDYSANQVKLFPNPANDVLIIESDLPIHNYSITIYNMLGSKIKFNKQQERTQLIIDVSELSPGIYLLYLLENEKQRTFQFEKL